MRAQTGVPETMAVTERDGCALYLAPGVTVAPADIEAAFRWLSAWDVAVPLMPYDVLAKDCGDEAERELTQDIVLDLRQMVYDPRVLFVRKGPDATALIETWRNEQVRCSHDAYCPLPFLRAVWKVKPMLLALPAGWVEEVAA